MTKLEALTEVLNAQQVYNEAHKRVTSFESKGGDAWDFISVSKATLFELMSASYEAGKRSK